MLPKAFFLTIILSVTGSNLLSAQGIPHPADALRRGDGLTALDIDGNYGIPLPGTRQNRWAYHATTLSMHTLWVIQGASVQMDRKRWSLQANTLLSGHGEWAISEVTVAYTHLLFPWLSAGILVRDRLIPGETGTHHFPETGLQLRGKVKTTDWGLRINGLWQQAQIEGYELRNPGFEFNARWNWTPSLSVSAGLRAGIQSRMAIFTGLQAGRDKFRLGFGASTLPAFQLDAIIFFRSVQLRCSLRYASATGPQPSTALGGTW